MTAERGKSAEQLAAAFIKKKGLRILAHNVTYPFGELDLVAEESETLVFIEVKYRRNLDFGFPEEAVSRAKQKKIIKAAKAYLEQFRKTIPPCRFDVVSMWGDLRAPNIEHIVDAFWDEGY